MKLLLKQAFSSLLNNKLFILVLMLLIFITGTSYTIFESTAGSFNSSYNKVTKQGKLHDAIIHPKFSSDTQLKLIDKSQKTTTTTPTTPLSGKIVVDPSVDKLSNLYTWMTQNQIIDINGNVYTVKKISGESISDFEKRVNEQINNLSSDIENRYMESIEHEYVRSLRQIYSNEIDARLIQSVSVLSNNIEKPSVKVVKYDYDVQNQNSQVNEVYVYDGNNVFINSLSDNQMKEKLFEKVKQKNPNLLLTDFNNTNFYKINKFKKYRWTVTPTGVPINPINLTDPSSLQAIVSPSYANKNNKRSISNKDFQDIINKNGLAFDSTFSKETLQKYKDNIIMVDNIPFFITGIGTTPDFSFPIVDASRPMPQVNNEAVVFVNNKGYHRVLDGFRHNSKEKYISIKFKDHVSQQRQEEIKNEIESYAKSSLDVESVPTANGNFKLKTMSWPSNINIVSDMDNPNDQLSLAQERISFLGKLRKAASSISIATTTTLIFFVSAIIILIFKAILSINRKKMATLISIGHQKSIISISLALASLPFIIIPTFLAYLVGSIIQYPMINIFANFWTIPTYGIELSFISALIVVILPTLTTALLIFLIGLYELRYPITDMLKNRIGTNDGLISKILAPIWWVNIKMKYGISLMLSNLGRLILVGLSAIISISSITIGLSNIGKANTAFNKTNNVLNYAYQVDLFTPTREGGLYKTIKLSDAKYKASTDQTYGSSGFNNGLSTDKLHWYVPSANDLKYTTPVNYQSLSPQDKINTKYFLKNKLITKGILNQQMAGSIRAWDILKKLMPENQRNAADNNLEEYIDSRENLNANSNTNFFVGQIDEDKEINPYIISYNNVIVNKEDEKYTYVNIDYNQNENIKNYNIIGFKEDTKYLKIAKEKINSLKIKNSNRIPILINKFIAKDLKLKVGSIFKSKIKNSINRFYRSNQFTQELYKPEKEFEVVGIIDTYDDGKMYTLKEYADQAIGYQSSNENIFNGIFTSKKNPLVLSNLPLYSPSGLYLPTDTLDSDWQQIVQDAISSNQINFASSANNFNSFKKLYNKTPYVSLISSVDWKNISALTFKNISQLSSKIIFTIQSIAIMLSILFTIIISSLLIESNKKKIATLWSLGYTKKEVIKIFAGNYILPILFSIIFSISISIAILESIKVFVMHFGRILIPFGIVWWAPIVAISLISFIFIISTIISIMRLNSHHAIEAFKGD